VSPRTQLIGIVSALALLIFVVELVRRRRLRIGYSLLWLLVGLSMLGLVLFQDVVIFLSSLIGLKSPRSLLFTAGIVFALLILLEHSLTLTILWRQDKSLAQEQALLEWRVRQLENLLHDSLTFFPALQQAKLAEGQPPSEQTLEEKIRESV